MWVTKDQMNEHDMELGRNLMDQEKERRTAVDREFDARENRVSELEREFNRGVLAEQRRLTAMAHAVEMSPAPETLMQVAQMIEDYLRGDGEKDAAAPEKEDERIESWNKLVEHPLFQSCFQSDEPLLDSMLKKLDDLPMGDRYSVGFAAGRQYERTSADTKEAASVDSGISHEIGVGYRVPRAAENRHTLQIDGEIVFLTREQYQAVSGYTAQARDFYMRCRGADGLTSVQAGIRLRAWIDSFSAL